MRSTLAMIDHTAWHDEVDYSAYVANVLMQAHARLESARVGSAEYRAAVDDLSYWQQAKMAPQQRKRLHWMLGLAYGKLGDHPLAITHYSHALEIAARLRGRYTPDGVANSYELLYQRARQYRATGHYADASRDLELALALVREFIAEDAPSYAILQLRLLAQLAGYTFFQGRRDASAHAIQRARNLIPLAPNLEYEAALVAWADAHLARARGKPDQALTIATQVLPIIERADACTQVRFHAFIAEAALDAAEEFLQLKHTRTYDHYVHTALQYVRVADEQAIMSGDVSGALLAWLVRMRQYRFAGRNYDRVTEIECVKDQGLKLGDHTLFIQAMISLGDEYAYQQRTEAALSCYRQAVGVSNSTQEPIVGHPALYKVLTVDDWRTDN